MGFLRQRLGRTYEMSLFLSSILSAEEVAAMMDWKSHDSRVFTSPVGTRRTKLSASGTLRALRGEIGVSEKKKGGGGRG